MENLESIGERIAKLRKAKGLTQNELAELTDGFNRDHITKLESGKVRHPKRELIAQIITILGTTYEWLELGEGPMFVDPTYRDKEEDNYLIKMLDLLIDDNDLDENLFRVLRDGVISVVSENNSLKEENMELKRKIFLALQRISELQKVR